MIKFGVIWITILSWWMFTSSECLEYDDYLWIFGGKYDKRSITGWLTLQIVNPSNMEEMSCLDGELHPLSSSELGCFDIDPFI